MDAEHRHELKTNTLAKWINNFPQWIKENVKNLIYFAVVLVLVVGAYLYHNRKTEAVSEKKLAFTQLATALPQTKSRIIQARGQGIDLSYSLLKVADDMANSAELADNADMASMAYIKRGDALRMELHYRTGTVTQQDIETQIALAKESYKKALEKSPSNPSLKAQATFGLGICEEEIGNFDAAEEIYKKIAETPEFEGATAAAAAKTRTNTMNDFKERLTFRPAPVIIDPNATAPVTLDINDVNLPTQ
jgi:tetratricopeptide (TPR) repeat protein